LWFQVRIRNIDTFKEFFSKFKMAESNQKCAKIIKFFTVFWRNEWISCKPTVWFCYLMCESLSPRLSSTYKHLSHHISESLPIHSNLWAVYFSMESKIGWYRNYSTTLVNFWFNAILNFEQKRIYFWNHSFHSHIYKTKQISSKS
jgi:hypothetical protein